MAEKRDRIVVEMTISAPVDTVWRAMREPEQMLNWFGWDADTLADEIQFIFFENAEADDANHVLRIHEHHGIADRMELTAVPGGTRLRVVRSSAVEDGEWDAFYEDTWEGWTSFFQQLRFLINRHPGETRRTIFLSGKLPPDGTLPIEALGLHGGGNGSEGSIALPDRPIVKGEFWHCNDHQLGLTVVDWGDALLIVTDKPAPNGGPNGGGSVVVTTFGLSGEAFDAIEAAWKMWWLARFPQD